MLSAVPRLPTRFLKRCRCLGTEDLGLGMFQIHVAVNVRTCIVQMQEFTEGRSRESAGLVHEPGFSDPPTFPKADRQYVAPGTQRPPMTQIHLVLPEVTIAV